MDSADVIIKNHHVKAQRLTRIAIIAVVFWTAPLFASMDAERNEFIYALPISEAEAVISIWLKNHGFQMVRNTGAGQSTHIEAIRAQGQWSIRLDPHSALATRIAVQTTMWGGFEPQTAALWQYLDHYIDQPPGKAAPPNKAAMPEAVLGALDAIVCIYVNNGGKDFQLSGFGIDRQGIIVSTAHDLEVGRGVTIRFRDGSRTTGRVMVLDARRDLSLIHTDDPLSNIISIHNGLFIPDKEATLFVLGCPSTGHDGIRCGILDGPPRRVDGMPIWQARMAIEPGSSGSPVLDADGRLTAIVKGRFRGSNDIGFLIPLESLLLFLENH